MREIKFRAWDGKLMHDVGELHWLLGGMKFYGPGVGKGWVDGTLNAERFPDLAQKPTVKLMQYTGLKDRNGVEIYEGDILFHSYIFFKDGPPIERKVEVVWWQDGFFHQKVGRDGEPGILDKLRYCEGFEIIGNVWEHPELLK